MAKQSIEEMYETAPDNEAVEEESNSNNPPADYKPLSQKQRQDWNGFVRYLNKEKKVGGNKELDDRTKQTGLQYLADYKKEHPDFSITPEMVPHVQYEFQQLKNKNSLPDVQPEGSVKTLVQDYFNNREVSPVDGWIGSLTSRQGYPEVTEFSNDPNKKYWGLDYQGAANFEKNTSGSAQEKKGMNFVAETGNPIVEDPPVTTSKSPDPMGDKEVIDFANNYVASPKYKERLSDFYKYPDYIQQQRKGVIGNISVRENPGGTTIYHDKGNEVAINDNQLKSYGATRQEGLSHEVAHAINSNAEVKGSALSDQEQNYILDRTKNLSPELKTSLLNRSKEQGKPLYEIMTGAFHDVNPAETKSDIDAFRFLLNKKGLYNAGKQDITPEIINKAKKDPSIRKSFITKRLLENFDDKDLIDIMNNVAVAKDENASDMV
jgi:hypothetical protein